MDRKIGSRRKSLSRGEDTHHRFALAARQGQSRPASTQQARSLALRSPAFWTRGRTVANPRIRAAQCRCGGAEVLPDAPLFRDGVVDPALHPMALMSLRKGCGLLELSKHAHRRGGISHAGAKASVLSVLPQDWTQASGNPTVYPLVLVKIRGTTVKTPKMPLSTIP
jgi:hypothetical protein